MLPGMEMMGCWDLAVPGEVMRHVVQVESSFNPYAIGVVGGRLVRQPRTLGEALATVRMLEEKGYNFSVGLAQVNRYNLAKYGLSSYERAFQTCDNLRAGSRILAECHQRAGGDWGKAFSCYYSGNFVTGFRHGYVQKVMASMGGSSDPGALAIALAGRQRRVDESRPSRQERATASLVTRRALSGAVAAAPAAAPPAPAPARVSTPAPGIGMSPTAATMAAAQPPAAAMPQAPGAGPVRVRLTGAPPLAPAPAAAAPDPGIAAAGAAPPGSVVSGSTASREGSRDKAFVF